MKTIVVALLISTTAAAQSYLPGGRTLLDAHNCYPYDGEYADRIDRALATGLPVAIEQDLVWYDDPEAGKHRAIVSHGPPITGEEPIIEDYFFERIRPIMEQAIADGNKADWPLVTLNVDYKNRDLEHIQDNYRVFSQYTDWLTWAEKTDTPDKAEPLQVGPLLILVGAGANPRKVFHDEIPDGGKVIAFGAVDKRPPRMRGLDEQGRWDATATSDLDKYLAKPASNYFRWWNDSWYLIESGGASRGEDWNEQDAARLNTIVKHAHKLGYWLRLYTLNGHTQEESQGWFANYNFGSTTEAQKRWQACIQTGVDFVATDMYEAFHETQQEN